MALWGCTMGVRVSQCERASGKWLSKETNKTTEEANATSTFVTRPQATKRMDDKTQASPGCVYRHKSHTQDSSTRPSYTSYRTRGRQARKAQSKEPKKPSD